MAESFQFFGYKIVICNDDTKFREIPSNIDTKQLWKSTIYFRANKEGRKKIFKEFCKCRQTLQVNRLKTHLHPFPKHFFFRYVIVIYYDLERKDLARSIVDFFRYSPLVLVRDYQVENFSITTVFDEDCTIVIQNLVEISLHSRKKEVKSLLNVNIQASQHAIICSDSTKFTVFNKTFTSRNIISIRLFSYESKISIWVDINKLLVKLKDDSLGNIFTDKPPEAAVFDDYVLIPTLLSDYFNFYGGEYNNFGKLLIGPKDELQKIGVDNFKIWRYYFADNNLNSFNECLPKYHTDVILFAIVILDQSISGYYNNYYFLKQLFTYSPNYHVLFRFTADTTAVELKTILTNLFQFSSLPVIVWYCGHGKDSTFLLKGASQFPVTFFKNCSHKKFLVIADCCNDRTNKPIRGIFYLDYIFSSVLTHLANVNERILISVTTITTSRSEGSVLTTTLLSYLSKEENTISKFRLEGVEVSLIEENSLDDSIITKIT